MTALYEFEVFRYERGGEGKRSIGLVLAEDADAAEGLAVALVPLRDPRPLKVSLRRPEGSMFAWSHDYQYGVCFRGPVETEGEAHE